MTYNESTVIEFTKERMRVFFFFFWVDTFAFTLSTKWEFILN